MTFDIDRIRSYKLGSGGVAPESALGVPTAQLLQKEMFKVGNTAAAVHCNGGTSAVAKW